MIIALFMKYGLWEKYKKRLYNRKVNLLYIRFRMVHEEYQPYFFEEMKKDFHKIIGHERYDEFMDCIYSTNKKRFMNVINSNDFDEFMQDYETIELENENKKLEKKLKKIKKENEVILNSTSWKITKPLRAFKRLIK